MVFGLYNLETFSQVGIPTRSYSIKLQIKVL